MLCSGFHFRFHDLCIPILVPIKGRGSTDQGSTLPPIRPEESEKGIREDNMDYSAGIV